MNEPITVTFVPEQLFTWLLIGLVAGVFASIIVRGRRFGFVVSILIGLMGAIIGGFLFNMFHIIVPYPFNGGITLHWSDIIAAFVGALLLLLILGGLFGGYGYYRRYRRPVVVQE